jgi:hypothetical protein
MTERNDEPQGVASEKRGAHKEHKGHKGHKKIMSSSVFIGVHRWLKIFSYHRYTPIHTDKSLMGDPGDCLLWRASSLVAVLP